MINSDIISKKLSKYQIEELGTIHNFKSNRGGKMKATVFIFSFFMMVAAKEHSLEQWAVQVKNIIKDLFSRSGIERYLTESRVKFAYTFSKKVLDENINKGNPKFFKTKIPKLLEQFNAVYIEDSTCLKLPESLAEQIPGSHSQKGNCSTARVQLSYEVKSEEYVEIEIQSYRDNDQKYAPHIVRKIK
jgi:hypothetical protein